LIDNPISKSLDSSQAIEKQQSSMAVASSLPKVKKRTSQVVVGIFSFYFPKQAIQLQGASTRWIYLVASIFVNASIHFLLVGNDPSIHLPHRSTLLASI
jgi:hypothetical protein